LPGQPEPVEHLAVEGDDLGDQAVLDAQYVYIEKASYVEAPERRRYIATAG
jgi:hypothetical protein